ncbi:MAG: glycosyltransferase [Acutalibacteraceae bacterium]
MNITIVCDVLGKENNGTTIAAMNLIRSLKSKGHKVNILCPDTDKKNTPGYFVVPTYNLGPINGYVAKNGVCLAKRDDSIIMQSIKDADIVHIMMPFSLGQRASYLAYKENIPVSAGFHVMAENFTTHIFMRNNPLVNRITYSYFSKLYKRCSAIHYPTQFLRDLYENMYGATNGYVISNGVNTIFHSCKAEKPAIYQDKFIIVSTGRYSKEKSHITLIDAVAKSKYKNKIQLIFAGSGPLKEKLEKQSEKLPVKPVFSFFPHEEMVSILNYADLYVHPAQVEAEGIACLEAISCGLVPIISDSPRCATKAYAIDEFNLFNYNSPESLAQRIDWWIEHAEEKAKRSKDYITYSQGQFDQANCMDKMEAMFLDTIKNAENKVCTKK